SPREAGARAMGANAGPTVRDPRPLHVLGRSLPRGADEGAHAGDLRGRAGGRSPRLLGRGRTDRASPLGGGDLVLERLPPLFAARLSGVLALFRAVERPRPDAGHRGATLLGRLLRRARSGARGDRRARATVTARAWMLFVINSVIWGVPYLFI